MVEIVIALITTSGIVVVALLQRDNSKKLKRIEGLTVDTKDQVANSHQTNLRDDLDAIHADIKGLRTQQARTETGMETVAAQQARVDAKVETLVARGDLATLQAQAEHRKLWDAITGGEPPMPATSEIDIIQMAQQQPQLPREEPDTDGNPEPGPRH